MLFDFWEANAAKPLSLLLPPPSPLDALMLTVWVCLPPSSFLLISISFSYHLFLFPPPPPLAPFGLRVWNGPWSQNTITYPIPPFPLTAPFGGKLLTFKFTISFVFSSLFSNSSLALFKKIYGRFWYASLCIAFSVFFRCALEHCDPLGRHFFTFVKCLGFIQPHDDHSSQSS